MLQSSDRRPYAMTRAAFVAVAVTVLVATITAAPSAAQPSTAPDSTTAQEPTTTTAPPASKGEGSGLTVSPAIVDNTADAGAKFVTQITLGNITTHAVPIEVTKGRLDTDQQPNEENRGKYDISSWFTIDTPAFILNPQARQTVNVTVDIPKNAEPGGHYATVFFGALAPSNGDAAGETLLNARVGVVFLITVRGDVHPGARLTGGIDTKTTQWDAGATTFRFGLENTGNVHFQPAGALVVKDIFGREVKELPLPVGYVLPGASRKYELIWERGLRPGYYTAEVKISAGVPLTAESRRFLILPLVVVVPAGFLIAVAVVSVIRHVLRKRRKVKRDAVLAAITATEPSENPADVAEAHHDASPDPSELDHMHTGKDGDVPPSPS